VLGARHSTDASSLLSNAKIMTRRRSGPPPAHDPSVAEDGDTSPYEWGGFAVAAAISLHPP